ncbi:MAG: class I SAM-dependent methyltransferase [Roseateles sp.]|uniref:class I SAM-dependent methyltransferase n=1 Tax=Roseateles sp. TaxID=1971397 RepID=UPI004036DA25
MSELDEIAQRYARRAGQGDGADRYSLLRPEVWQMWQERQRELLKLLAKRPGQPAEWCATEVGCGAGGNLLDLLRLGLLPAHLSGIELLPERLAAARASLPEGVRLIAGDASSADIAPASQDLVLQSTVFSSILDDALQQRVADAMWRWLKPGGAIVWYDFTINNPRNPDVRGVPLRRVRELFPGCEPGRFTARRVTLAPPLARALPAAYGLFNLAPWLRTHRLVLIEKR